MHSLMIWIVFLCFSLVAPVAGAALLISEAFYDGVGSDNGLSFVELYGPAGSSLGGLFLEGVNGANGSSGPTIALSGVIPADGIFVVADDSGDGSTTVSGADLIINFDFQNGPDSIVLRSADAVVDALGYGVFGFGEIFAGEGTPAADAPAGSSLARYFANVDSDDNATDFGILSAPTPGEATLMSVPEPSSVGLLISGLLGIAGLRRTGCAHRAA
jgi:hypothetical protein